MTLSDALIATPPSSTDRPADPHRVIEPATGYRPSPTARGSVPLVIADTAAITAALTAVGMWSPADLAFAALVIGVQATTGAYAGRLNLRLLDDVPRTLLALAVPLLALTPLSLLHDGPPSYLHEIAWLIVLLPTARLVVYAAIRRANRRGPGEALLLIGSGPVAVHLAEHLLSHPEHGVRPVGLVDVDVRLADAPVPQIGHLADLADLVSRHGVRRLVVADTPVADELLAPLIRLQMSRGVDVHVVPRLHAIGVGWDHRRVEEVGGLPLVRLRPAAPLRPAWSVKRVMDVVGVIALLIAAAPVMAVVATAVRLTSPGPVLFRQVRIGRHGRPFELLKFRSMFIDHDPRTWSAAGDDGVTRVGRAIRCASLDELPQLINVLRGDMSLVGPRPERPPYVDRFCNHVPGYADRHRLPVGLTGWSQVSGHRGDTSITRRAQYDNGYVERWSLWFDIVLLVRTAGVVIGDIVSRRQA